MPKNCKLYKIIIRLVQFEYCAIYRDRGELIYSLKNIISN